MPYVGVHKEPVAKGSFFYVDWVDKSNYIALVAAAALFIFGFYYIFKALGFIG